MLKLFYYGAGIASGADDRFVSGALARIRPPRLQ